MGVGEGGGGVVRFEGEDGGADGAGEDVGVPAVDDLCVFMVTLEKKNPPGKHGRDGHTFS